MSLATVVVALAVTLGAVTSEAGAEDSFRLTAHQDFGLSLDHTWTVRIVGTELTVDRPGRKPKTRRLSPKDVDNVMEALKTNDFRSLGVRVGPTGVCDDCPRCVLEVNWEGGPQRVTVYSLGEPPHHLPDELQRFLSVWKTVKRIAGVNRLRDACP